MCLNHSKNLLRVGDKKAARRMQRTGHCQCYKESGNKESLLDIASAINRAARRMQLAGHCQCYKESGNKESLLDIANAIKRAARMMQLAGHCRRHPNLQNTK